jgi:hypothetical protein
MNQQRVSYEVSYGWVANDASNTHREMYAWEEWAEALDCYLCLSSPGSPPYVFVVLTEVTPGSGSRRILALWEKRGGQWLWGQPVAAMLTATAQSAEEGPGPQAGGNGTP